MSIRVDKFWLVYESITGIGIEPEYLSITREDVEKYMKNNPMSEDSAYTKEELIEDLTMSSGFYVLPEDTKEETRDYVAEMLNELIK